MGKIECYYCKDKFRRGSGHLAYCSQCEEAHAMCNPCYVEAKKEGNITDMDLEIDVPIHARRLEKWT